MVGSLYGFFGVFDEGLESFVVCCGSFLIVFDVNGCINVKVRFLGCYVLCFKWWI